MTGQRWHAAYTEPHSIHGTWTSPASCHATEEEARARIAGVTALAGPDAARRRTWSVTPCDEHEQPHNDNEEEN